jgi:hypothetical protein
MAGLDPVIHVPPTVWVSAEKGVDHRVEPGDDDRKRTQREQRAGFAKAVSLGWWPL